MSDRILVNKYIPEVVPEDLSRYERDGFITYTDQWKYNLSISDPDRNIEKAKVINFDMIYVKCGRAPQQYFNRHYQISVCVEHSLLPDRDFGFSSRKEKN